MPNIEPSFQKQNLPAAAGPPRIALALQPLFNESIEVAPLIHCIIASLKKRGVDPSMSQLKKSWAR
jgi:hypothetical protein